MYTTKLVHKSMVDGNRYITIGDPYKDRAVNPFRQSKRGDKAPFHAPQIPKNAEDGNFSKLEYKAAGFQEDIKYINKQPLETRKKGFGSRDADRRDEFSSNMRTEQYRETLRKEIARNKQGSQQLEEELQKLINERTQTMNMSTTVKKDDVCLFDIGRTRVTPFDPKSTKDTYYHFKRDTDKNLGNTKPASCDIGDGAWDITYKPPSYGGKSEVKNFFDKSHLTV